MVDTPPSLPGLPPKPKRRWYQFRRQTWLIVTLVSTVGFTCWIGIRMQGRPYVDPDAPQIVQAAQRGQHNAVKQILSHDSSALTATDSIGNSAAAWAILNDHHDIAIYLIEQGYPIEPSTDSTCPLIMHCLSRYTEGSRAMLKYLLENGADPNVTYKPEGWIPLHMAVNNGQEEKVRLLIKHGAKLDSKDRYGETPMVMAKRRVVECKDPTITSVHGEFDDPQVRQAAINRWEHMVKLLAKLDDGR